MTIFLSIAGVVCAWAMLSILASERAQGLRELERKARQEAKEAAALPPPPPPAPMVVATSPTLPPKGKAKAA
jgi:hypothetical protein